jgi:RNA polymerase-binding transcription factor DksA
VRALGVFCFSDKEEQHMSDREVVLVDLVTSSESRVCLSAAAEISELLIEDVEWALEEYGICETDRYRIIDTE